MVDRPNLQIALLERTKGAFNASLDDALGDHGQDQITLFAGLAIEQSRQFQAFDRVP
jgi:hypothetical protein